MNNRNNRFRGNRSHHNQHRQERKPATPSNVDDNNPIVKSFRAYAIELDDKHDRYERIVKYSRDITIESKRLIFLLHTVDMRNPNAKKTLTDAYDRLNNLCTNSFASIAKELNGRDAYQYGRAYSAGIQEFVEAYTYYEYLFKDECTMKWDDLQEKLTFTLKLEDDNQKEAVADVSSAAAATAVAVDALVLNEPAAATVAASSDSLPQLNATKEVNCLVQPIEFMLGLADLSGEIMRKCINALGSGDVKTCRACCQFIQNLYSGYLSIGAVRNREMSRKMHAMYQSVLKVEKVCYNVTVRGSEAAIWSSNDAMEKERHDDADEGFVNF